MLPAIDAFILHLATERGLSVNYQLLVRRVLESLADWLKTKHQIETPADVTTAHLSDHLVQRKKDGLAASSARVELIAVKIFFRWLVARGHRIGDPAEPILPPRQELPLPDTLNEQQIRQLLESVTADDPLSRRDRAILELFYAAGLRLSELTSARLESVSLEEGWIRVTGKGAKTRLAPVGSAARDAIATYLTHARPPNAAPASPVHASNKSSTNAPPPLASPKKSIPTSSAIASPPTSSTTAPTSASSRKCSATPTSPPPRSTPTSTKIASAPSTKNSTPAPDSKFHFNFPTRSCVHATPCFTTSSVTPATSSFFQVSSAFPNTPFASSFLPAFSRLCPTNPSH